MGSRQLHSWRTRPDCPHLSPRKAFSPPSLWPAAAGAVKHWAELTSHTKAQQKKAGTSLWGKLVQWKRYGDCLIWRISPGPVIVRYMLAFITYPAPQDCIPLSGRLSGYLMSVYFLPRQIAEQASGKVLKEIALIPNLFSRWYFPPPSYSIFPPHQA